MHKAFQTGAVALFFAIFWAFSPTARLEAQTYSVSESGLAQLNPSGSPLMG